MSKEGKKRPVGLVGEDSDGLQGNLASLAGQIDFFESAATLVQSEPSVKKPALGVHSLTQNTTHGKIRVGPDFQAVLPPLPQSKN